MNYTPWHHLQPPSDLSGYMRLEKSDDEEGYSGADSSDYYYDPSSSLLTTNISDDNVFSEYSFHNGTVVREDHTAGASKSTSLSLRIDSFGDTWSFPSDTSSSSSSSSSSEDEDDSDSGVSSDDDSTSYGTTSRSCIISHHRQSYYSTLEESDEDPFASLNSSISSRASRRSGNSPLIFTWGQWMLKRMHEKTEDEDKNKPPQYDEHVGFLLDFHAIDIESDISSCSSLDSSMAQMHDKRGVLPMTTVKNHRKNCIQLGVTLPAPRSSKDSKNKQVMIHIDRSNHMANKKSKRRNKLRLCKLRLKKSQSKDDCATGGIDEPPRTEMGKSTRPQKSHVSTSTQTAAPPSSFYSFISEERMPILSPTTTTTSSSVSKYDVIMNSQDQGLEMPLSSSPSRRRPPPPSTCSRSMRCVKFLLPPKSQRR